MYPNLVHFQLVSGKAIEAVKVDMSMSFITPSSVNWILFAYDCIHYVPDVICNNFFKAGIVDALKVPCV